MALPVLLRLPDVIGSTRVGGLVLGAVFYALGAVVYARRWPNPMDFSLTTQCYSHPPGYNVLAVMSLLALLVGSPLFLLWLRRSPRNALDVLQAASALPVSSDRRLLDFASWMLEAASLLILPVAGTAMIYATVFFDWPNDGFYGVVVSGTPAAEPSWGWVAAATLAATACLLRWLRSPASPDVLRVRAQA
jgi:predicted membrane channel-forming protein YqfA (hemolysin III family)